MKTTNYSSFPQKEGSFFLKYCWQPTEVLSLSFLSKAALSCLPTTEKKSIKRFQFFLVFNMISFCVWMV